MKPDVHLSQANRVHRVQKLQKSLLNLMMFTVSGHRTKKLQQKLHSELRSEENVLPVV